MDVGTVEVGKAVVEVTADDGSGAGTDDDTTEDATDVDDAAVASRVDDVVDPHAASTITASTYAREFTDRRYTRGGSPMTTLARARHRPRRRPIDAATRIAVVLTGVVVLAGSGGGCSDAECATTCARPGVGVRWFPGDLLDAADVTLCLDDNCAGVEPIQVGGGFTAIRDHESDKTIDVQLIATDASTGVSRTLTGSGRLASGKCDCPFLALHVEDDRLER